MNIYINCVVTSAGGLCLCVTLTNTNIRAYEAVIWGIRCGGNNIFVLPLTLDDVYTVGRHFRTQYIFSLQPKEGACSASFVFCGYIYGRCAFERMARGMRFHTSLGWRPLALLHLIQTQLNIHHHHRKRSHHNLVHQIMLLCVASSIEYMAASSCFEPMWLCGGGALWTMWVEMSGFISRQCVMCLYRNVSMVEAKLNGRFAMMFIFK